MPRIDAAFLKGFATGASHGGQGFAMGDQAYQDGFEKEAQYQTKLAQMLAATRSADASARHSNASADFEAAKTNVLNNRPALFDEQVAASSGTDIPMVRMVRQAIAGSPQRSDMGPPTEDGTMSAVPIDPQKYSGITRAIQQNMALLANSGDINPEQMAKAAGQYRDFGQEDQIMAGKLDPTSVARAKYAIKGSAPYHFDASGLVGNNLTGGVDLSNPRASAYTGEIQAKTRQADASAGASNAQAAKINQEIQQGGKTGQTQIVTDANGNVTLVDKATGQARPAIGPDGKPLQGKGGDLNEGQSNALTFATRMDAADKILADLAAQGVDKPGQIKRFAESIPLVGGGAGTFVNMAPSFMGGPSGPQQQVEQAQRDFINAVLRRESGAAISMGEFQNAAQQYFPQPGDTAPVIKQKAAARRRVIDGMLQAVPANKRPTFGSKTVQVDY